MATNAPVLAEAPRLLRPEFDDALFQFLQEAHRTLGGAPFSFEDGIESIYKMYSRAIVHHHDLDNSEAYEILLQFMNLLEDRGDKGPLWQEDPESEFQLIRDADKYLGEGYFWYCYERQQNAQRRVYVHISGAEGAAGVLNCLAAHLDGDFKSIKCFGPDWWHKRLDTIVAYCENKEGQNKVLGALEGLNPGWFAEGLPQFVKPRSKGVGTADHPPQVAVFEGDKSVQSFGKFMSKLICVAYRHTVGRGFEKFLEAVLVAFRVAHIDPKKPYKHSRRAEVEEMNPTLNQSLQQALRQLDL
jgi:HopA1 effector protein family